MLFTASRDLLVSNLVYIPDGPDVLRLSDTKPSAETVNAVLWGLTGGGHGPVGGIGYCVHELCQRGGF